MPTCIVTRCTSGGRIPKDQERPIRLFRFPYNNIMRQKWIEAMGLQWSDIYPTARVCELHFQEDAFIPSDMNKNKRGYIKKLKNLLPDAVPTIFEEGSSPDGGKPVRRRRRKKFSSKFEVKCEIPPDIDITEAIAKIQTSNDHCYNKEKDMPRPVRFMPDRTTVQRIGNQTFQIVSGVTTESQAEIEHLKKKVKALEIENDILFKSIRRVFHDDQISRLSGNIKVQWGSETVAEALKLKYACGEFGYEYLRTKGYPFPSLCIVDEQISQLKVNPKVFTQCTNLMKAKSATLNDEPSVKVPSKDEPMEESNIDLFDEIDI